MIISRTPFRISFFGGGTDYPFQFPVWLQVPAQRGLVNRSGDQFPVIEECQCLDRPLVSHVTGDTFPILAIPGVHDVEVTATGQLLPIRREGQRADRHFRSSRLPGRHLQLLSEGDQGGLHVLNKLVRIRHNLLGDGQVTGCNTVR